MAYSKLCDCADVHRGCELCWECSLNQAGGRGGGWWGPAGPLEGVGGSVWGRCCLSVAGGVTGLK